MNDDWKYDFGGFSHYGYYFNDDFGKLDNEHGRKSYPGERAQPTNAQRQRKAAKRKMVKQSRKQNRG